jgi:hypothetical protein
VEEGIRRVTWEEIRGAIREDIAPAFFKWLGFSVVLSAVPLLIVAAQAYMKGVPPHVEDHLTFCEYLLVVMTARGEIFVLTAGLSAAAAGDLAAAKKAGTTGGIFLLALCIVVVVVAGALFGSVSESYDATLSAASLLAEVSLNGNEGPVLEATSKKLATISGENAKELSSLIEGGAIRRTAKLAGFLFLCALALSGMVVTYTVVSGAPARSAPRDAEESRR